MTNAFLLGMWYPLPFSCGVMRRSHMKERCIKIKQAHTVDSVGLGCFTKEKQRKCWWIPLSEQECHINRDVYAELETASFFKWSMKTCRLTSSVRIGAPVSCGHTGWFSHFTNIFPWHNSDPVITWLNQNTFSTKSSLCKTIFSG